MARLSDIIEVFIKEMLQNTTKSQVEIKRNELANYFGCAPSQINYVLTTRFTIDKGYYIESKRGGGGFILITRIDFTGNEQLLDKLNEKIGDSITYDSASGILDSLMDLEVISERECKIIKTTLNDRILCSCADKSRLRAEILRGILMVILQV